MEQIINYRDIPTNKRIDILNALERIGFFPAYGGVKTMQQIMEKSVPGLSLIHISSGALAPRKPKYGDLDYYTYNEGESL